MFTLTRSLHNPILSPVKEHPWEALAAFNGCPIIVRGKTHILYRAMSEPEQLHEPHMSVSVIGSAVAKDGYHYNDRKILFGPSTDFDKYGCEDPRVTKISSTYYIFYTALSGYPFSADNIKVAVALSSDLKKIDEKHMVTPFNAKAMAMFPEKINGKMAALLTINTDKKPSDICYIEFNKKEDIWTPEYWNEWQKNIEVHKISMRRLDGDQVELGAPPIETPKGWLIIYSHIQNYSKDDQLFGIEAVLLDLNNPRKILGRTRGSIMIPADYYELVGQFSNIIFPTGALKKGKDLEIYYGGADTHTAIATVNLENLLESLVGTPEARFSRFLGNPIISPRPGVAWEAGGTLNPAAIDLGKKIHIIYRGATPTNVSVFGYASSKDGFTIEERPEKPIYLPRSPFEMKENSSENYGCEDPRMVSIGDEIYMTYTAYDGMTPRVAVTHISTEDFLKKKWDMWAKPEIITPPNIPNKDSAILPEKIKGKYMILHRAGNGICADLVSSLDFSKEKIDECIEIIMPRHGMWDGEKVGIAGPPVKTKNGWLLMYHGVSKTKKYRVGAVLLDLNDPTTVLSRTATPIFEPEEQYEKFGLIPNVVFPCSLILRKGTVYIYYGAADSVIGVATISLKSLLKILKN